MNKNRLLITTALILAFQSFAVQAMEPDEHETRDFPSLIPSSPQTLLPQISPVNRDDSATSPPSFLLSASVAEAPKDIPYAVRSLSWARERAEEAPFLTEQQRALRETILRATHAEPDLAFYAKQVLKKFKPELEALVGSLKQPAALIKHPEEITSVAHLAEHGERHLGKLNEVLAALEAEKAKLVPQNPAHEPEMTLFNDLISYYTEYKQALLNAPSFEHLKELLTLKVRLTGDHLGYYLIPQKMARELSWRDLYGSHLHKTNRSGNHHVLGRAGAHFKLSAEAHTDEGGLNELCPGIEYAVSSLYQLLDPRIAPPSSLLVLQKQRLYQLPADHPFTKGINLVALATNLLAEEFLNRNPDVKEALEREGITSYKEFRFLQGSLTAGDMGLDEFLRLSEQDLNLLNKIDRASFSALCIGALLTNPSDWKPDNFRVQVKRDGEENIISATLIAIDNDDALVPSISPLYMEGHSVGPKNVLYFLKSLMDEAIDKQFRKAFLGKTPEALLLEWVESLEEQNKRYASLLSEDALTERSLHNLSLPIRFLPGTLVTLYEKLVNIHNALSNHKKINHTALFKRLDPIVWRYYDQLTSLSNDDLLAIVKQKHPRKVGKYEALFQQETCRPLVLTDILYGQRTHLSLAVEDICDLNDGFMIEGKDLTLGEALSRIKFDRGTPSPQPEELDQSWQNLARKTNVGRLLFQKAVNTNNQFLAGRLLAIGVGDIKDILEGVATLDPRINKLQLNQKELTDTHAKTLGQSLAKNPHVSELSVEDNQITGQGLESLLKGMGTHNKVVSLNLGRNPLTFQDVHTLNPLLHIVSLNLSQTSITDRDMDTFLVSPLQHLNISKTKLSEAAGETILRKLSPHLLTLNVSYTQMARGVIRGLPSNRTLVSIDFSHAKVDDEMFANLVRVLASNSTLKTINLHYNGITAKSGKSLRDLLRKNTTVSYLDLSNNGLGNEGTQSLAKGLKRNSTLEELILSRNLIEDTGAQALYKAVTIHPSLRLLNLDYNEGVRKKTLKQLRLLQDIKPQLHISVKKVYESEI